MRSLVVIGILALSAFPFIASAQALGSLPTGTAFMLSVSPQYPMPFGQAVLSPLSDSLDLSRAEMIVSVNGKETYRGNVRPVAIQLGGAGNVSTAKVTIAADGTNHVQTVSIQPQEVMLIPEPLASVPPLYPGKPSVPMEGSVRVIAMANLKSASGAAPNPAALSYAWNVDGTNIANSSGIGKRVLMVASPLQYRDRTVSVSVTSPDGTLVGGSTLTLSASEPHMRVYENDPLLGIRFERAVGGTERISGSERAFYAAPFFFPVHSGAPVIEWFLNGKSVQSSASITLRPSGEGEGRASLSATASAGDFAKAAASFTVLFGAARSGFFGL